MRLPTFSEWLKARDGKPSSPRGMTKADNKCVKSPGSRCHTDDLSSDYKGHIAHNGEEEPFKCLKKGGTPKSQVPK